MNEPTETTTSAATPTEMNASEGAAPDAETLTSAQLATQPQEEADAKAADQQRIQDQQQQDSQQHPSQEVPKKTLAMVLEAGSFGAPPAATYPPPEPIDLDATVVTTPSLLENPILADAHEQLTSPSSSPFVNHGLIQWEAARKAWLGNRTTAEDDENPTTAAAVRAAKPLDVDEIIDIIFLSSSSSHKGGPVRFPQNVALPQMVDILQGETEFIDDRDMYDLLWMMRQLFTDCYCTTSLVLFLFVLQICGKQKVWMHRSSTYVLSLDRDGYKKLLCEILFEFLLVIMSVTQHYHVLACTVRIDSSSPLQ